MFSDATNMLVYSFFFIFWFCCCYFLLLRPCFVFIVTRKHENSYCVFCTCFPGNAIRGRILGAPLFSKLLK